MLTRERAGEEHGQSEQTREEQGQSEKKNQMSVQKFYSLPSK